MSESSISSLRKNAAGLITEVQVNGGMHPGNSGGPIVDARGVVVGIAVAVITGTQINFAVPGEKVHNLFNGCANETGWKERYQVDGGSPHLPIELTFLDPLERIRNVKLEVWSGPVGPPRPESATQPAPLPGDGPRKQVDMKFAAGRAEADIAVPAVDAGHAIWLQPVMADAFGQRRWGAATAYKPSDLPPLQRERVHLALKLDSESERTVRLENTYKLNMHRSNKQSLITDIIQFEALEKPQRRADGGRHHLYLGPSFFVTEVDGRREQRHPSILPLLRNRAFRFDLSAEGRLTQRSVPRILLAIPFAEQQAFRDVVDQVASVVETTCIPVPNRDVAPMETWPLRLPTFTLNGRAGEAIDMVLTCQYEGIRKKDGKELAFVNFSGRLEPRDAKNSSLCGLVEGHAQYDLQAGFLAEANVQVKSESDAAESNATITLAYKITRVPGNTAGIYVDPPKEAPETTKGKLLKATDYTLAAQDVGNLPGKRGCAFKQFEVAMRRGEKYIFEMISQSVNDPYLMLMAPNGQVVAEDDDSAGDLNARIVYEAPVSGLHTITTTTLGERDFGAFTLRILDAAPEKQ